MSVTDLVKKEYHILQRGNEKLRAIPLVEKLLLKTRGTACLPSVKSFSSADTVSFTDGIDEAILIFAPQADQEEYKKLRNDVIDCWFKYMTTPEEYFIFGFQGKTADERRQFVSRAEKDRVMSILM